MAITVQVPANSGLLLSVPDPKGQVRLTPPELRISADEDVTVTDIEVIVDSADPEIDRGRHDIAGRIKSAYMFFDGQRTIGKGKPDLVLAPTAIVLSNLVSAGSQFRLTIRVEFQAGGKASRFGPRTFTPAKSFTLRVISERDLDPDKQTGASRAGTLTEYPGFVAIDLGTSNSTVTLHDRAVVEQVSGLAAEQEERLQDLIFRRILSSTDAACLLPGVEPRDWNALLERIAKNLGAMDGDPKTAMIHRIRSGGESMLQALLQLEVNLAQFPFKQVVVAALDDVYHEAFLEPRLRSQSMLIVNLDPVYPKESDIVSALKLLGVELPMDAMMGRQVLTDYRNAVAQAGQHAAPSGQGSAAVIQQQYHLSPKRQLIEDGREFSIALSGKTATRKGADVVQAAYKHLLDRTAAWQTRNPQLCSQGRFTRAIVTYPTVAPPSIRAEVETLVRPLVALVDSEGRRKEDVVTDYDEAVAAALFYLHREFGGSVDLGPEAFKAMSRRSNDKWYQNVLVLDIGGGSTDLALLRLTLSEIDPFQPGEDRGAGGRCYVIEPRLLGSSGNLHLGGNLISLRLFQVLKALIADRILTAFQDGHLMGAALSDRLEQLGEPFVDKNGRYIPQSISNAVMNLPRLDPDFADALYAADLVIPTRYKDEPSRLQAFYSVWEHAETAKLKLGASGKPDAFSIGEKEVTTLLAQCGIPHEVVRSEALTVELDVREFDKVAEPVVAEAVDIACGLLENGLTQRDERTRAVVGREPLDWLILSGKSCNLDMVRRVIRREFMKSRDLVWNADRVTFVPEYAKLATSAGACYAEKMRRIALDPTHFTDELRRGLNQLTFNINNLFFFLPCSFLVPIMGGNIEIFSAGERLFRLDEEEVGKARSKAIGPQLLMSVLRRDYPKATPILWGSFDGLELAVELGEKPDDFQKKYQIQFEIDYRLSMRYFIWEGARPHYKIEQETPSVTTRSTQAGSAKPAKSEPVASELVPSAGINIFVNVQQAQATGKEPLKLLGHNQPLIETFHYKDGSTARGITIVLPDNFDMDGKMDIYATTEDNGSLQLLGSIARPGENKASREATERSRTTVFPRRYSLSLDEHGGLRVHLGEVPYWRADSFDDWKNHSGMVLRRDLGMVQPPPLEDRDPFCGKH